MGLRSLHQGSSWLLLIAIYAARVAAQNGDGGATSGNLPASSIDSTQDGSQGEGSGSYNFSTGAIVGVAIVVAIVVIAGICLATLFYQAKKRQWTLRETLRHSRRRVATGLKGLASPITPYRTKFSPVKTEFNSRDAAAIRGPSRLNPTNTKAGVSSKTGDLEKGEAVAMVQTRSRSDSTQQLRPKPKLTIPTQQQEPTGTSPQTPMWHKFIGRQ